MSLYTLYRRTTSVEPARGYTSLGLTLGIGAAALLVAAALYVWRKRAGQEYLPGRLQTWLRVHFWLSLLAGFAALLHAGFHLDDTWGSVTLLLLGFVVLTGVGGWILYVMVPAAVAQPGVGNLAIPHTLSQIDRIERRIDEALAGRSDAFRARANAMRVSASAQTGGALAPEEEQAFDDVRHLVAGLGEEKRRLRAQKRLHGWVRVWLWAHVPASVGFLVLLPFHAYDALDARWLFTRPSPSDFADPRTCAECHRLQYDEWSASMHAMAQASPTVDLQNRLVLAKEARERAAGRPTPPIGNLCVKCHAPTGSQPFLADAEDPLARIGDRAPAGRFGVSCVTCHQVSSYHPNPPPGNKPDFIYRNAENLEWSPGRTMFGPFGRPGNLPSIGNASHQGAYRSFQESNELCASCHTVTLEDPQTHEVRVPLQTTYYEWKDGGDINWSAEGIGCLDCHGRDLSEVRKAVERMHGDLASRRDAIVELIRRNARSPLPAGQDVVADAPGGFDLPITRRRRYLHTFVGVDYPLGSLSDHPEGDPLHGGGARLRTEHERRIDDLLKIAAAVRIRGIEGSNLVVEVMNLAAGHRLPAGFAFAREMWLEVGVARPGSGNFDIVLGGHADRPLEPTEDLDKVGEGPLGLRNFQAVLFNENGTGENIETVLQNEATAVLTGPDAVRAGEAKLPGGRSLFADRERFLLPGEARLILIPLASLTGYSPTNDSRVRVRLRFRNFPTRFLNIVADRLHVEAYTGVKDDVALARSLVNHLRIVDMAEDIWPGR